MTIAPIVRTVTVKAPPARAFELFASHIADWWPRGQTVGKKPHVALVIEPRTGGKWFERDADGVETHWGHVLDWQPPTRLLLAWQLSTSWAFDPNLHTEVELIFAPNGNGTLVTLTHRNLEQFGTDAVTHVASLGNGWPTKLVQFQTFADAQP
jgi:hypothetical protein